MNVYKSIDGKLSSLFTELENEWLKENPGKQPKEFRQEASIALVRLAASSGSVLGMTLSSGVAIFIDEYELTARDLCVKMITGTLENMFLEKIHEANKGKPEN